MWNTYYTISYIELLNLKVEFNMTVNCYDRIVAIIKKMLLKDEKFVGSFYASKKMMKGLGMGYEKIDAWCNVAYFSIRRTNKRAHAMYAVQIDLSRDKRVGIRRTYCTRFFDTFSLLLDFRCSTCPRVLSDWWDGTKKDYASISTWCVIRQTTRLYIESNSVILFKC